VVIVAGAQNVAMMLEPRRIWRQDWNSPLSVLMLVFSFQGRRDKASESGRPTRGWRDRGAPEGLLVSCILMEGFAPLPKPCWAASRYPGSGKPPGERRGAMPPDESVLVRIIELKKCRLGCRCRGRVV
jgi:hypothetical protein